MLGSFQDHVGIMLGSFWDHFVIILGSFGDHFGIIRGLALASGGEGGESDARKLQNARRPPLAFGGRGGPTPMQENLHFSKKRQPLNDFVQFQAGGGGPPLITAVKPVRRWTASMKYHFM